MNDKRVPQAHHIAMKTERCERPGCDCPGSLVVFTLIDDQKRPMATAILAGDQALQMLRTAQLGLAGDKIGVLQ